MKAQILCFVLAFCTGAVISAENTYKAAVVEYNHETKSSIYETLLHNTKLYGETISFAQTNGADIVIFPECGLTGTDAIGNDSYSTIVPNPKDLITPCDNTTGFEKFFIDISCFARTNRIYVVVNLQEKDNRTSPTRYYNTNIAFARNGTVVGKYRKINLYNSETVTLTAGSELSTFDTDFGVTFGMFTCFDILYKYPAIDILSRSKHIIYPTAWYSETPFLTAPTVQAGYARANNANLLASGFSKPSLRNGGSGIYLNNGTTEIIIPRVDSTKVIIREVVKSANRVPLQPGSQTRGPIVPAPTVDNFKTEPENMNNYTTKTIDGSLSSELFEYGSLKCTVSANIQNRLSSIIYKAVIYDGPRLYGDKLANNRICGIVACSGDICGDRLVPNATVNSFEIIATFPKDRSNNFYFPSTLRTDMKPLDNSAYDYKVTEDEDSVTIKMVSNTAQNDLLTVAIYGRADKNSAGFMTVNVFGLVFSVFLSIFYSRQ